MELFPDAVIQPPRPWDGESPGKTALDSLEAKLVEAGVNQTWA